MSVFTDYNCSCLDEIEKDVIQYLDNKPEIKVILEKKTLAIEDVISFIKTMNLEIRDITQYYMMITEIRLINRSHMEEEYLDDVNFPYNIHRREWYSNPCPSYKEETYIEEEVQHGSYGYDDYYIDTYEYTDNEACDIYPGFDYMVIDCMKTYLYNKLSSGIIHKHLHKYTDFDQELKDLLSKIENKITNIVDNQIYSRQWKGSWFYFYQIFGFPKYFSKYYYIFDMYIGTNQEDKLIDFINQNKNNVDVSKCKKEYYHNFKGMIEGHPLASNGIFQEGLQELQELGCCN